MKTAIKNLFLTIIFIILSVNTSNAQVLEGSVLDGNGNPIRAKILIKRPNNIETVSEFILVSKGKFSYQLKKTYETTGVFLEVTATGYTSYEEVIYPSDFKKTINFNFILYKDKIEKLDEVFIESKVSPLTVKKDTVTYRVDSFRDGTERKVEDLLRNLPGIQINDENGEISYKGKAIETITIEGDNLFDYNYTIGSKNINIDLVKEIEAIENYSENKLLKGIENSDKVILNLNLKENKVDFSLSTDLGVGDFPDNKTTPLDLSANLLGLNKKYKAFGTSTFNNIGKNTSPFNYFNSNINIEQSKERELLATKIIPEFNSIQITRDNLSNVNNQFFSNLNGIYSLSDKIKTKVNLFFISDRLNSNQFSEETVILDNESFIIFNNEFIKKKPLQYRGDVEIKFNTSPSSLIEYNISLRDEAIDTERTIFSNQENNFNSALQTKNVFLKQNLEYTKKISDKKALQLNLKNSTNNLDQKFDIQPFNSNSSGIEEGVQDNYLKKQNTSFKALLLGRKNTNNKYRLSLGFKMDNESFKSNLYGLKNDQNISVGNRINNLDFRKNSIYTQGAYNWNFGKFTISTNLKLSYLRQNLEQENTIMDSSRLIFEPSLDVTYKLDRTSVLTFNTGINSNSASISNLFTNPVLLDNRTVVQNIPNISLQQNQSYNLLFSKNDIFNQIQLSLGASYNNLKGNFFNDISINENSTVITNFFQSEYAENINFNLNFSKLLPVLKTNFKINSDYSIFNFKNIVNNSDLKSNKSVLFNNSLFLKTAFNLPINLENEFIYTFQENRSSNVFFNKSLQNDLRLLFKISKEISGTFSYNYFIPSLNSKLNNYSFLGANVIFRPIHENWQAEISGVNLLDEKYFVQESTSAISINIFRLDLLERYLLLKFSYLF